MIIIKAMIFFQLLLLSICTHVMAFSSISHSGINTQHIFITDEAAQFALTGKTAKESKTALFTTLNTDSMAKHNSAVTNRFDAQKVQQSLDMQREVSRDFGQIAPKVVASSSDFFANSKAYESKLLEKTALEAALSQTQNPQQAAELQSKLNQVESYLSQNHSQYQLWTEGGLGRAALQALVGGTLTGDVTGAIASGSTSLAAPLIERASQNTGALGKSLIDLSAGAAIGAITGGNTGAVMAASAVDWHNRQLHPKEIELIKHKAKDFAAQQSISQEQALGILAAETLRGISDDFAYLEENKAARAYLNQFQSQSPEGQNLFGILDRKGTEYNNSLINAEHIYPHSSIYANLPKSFPEQDTLIRTYLGAANEISHFAESSPEKLRHVLGDMLNIQSGYNYESYKLSHQHNDYGLNRAEGLSKSIALETAIQPLSDKIIQMNADINRIHGNDGIWSYDTPQGRATNQSKLAFAQAGNIATIPALIKGANLAGRDLAEDLSKYRIEFDSNTLSANGFGGFRVTQKDTITTTYNSIKEAPQYPQGFSNIQNGVKKFTINNNKLLGELRKFERGDWKKVYRNGYDSNGNKISIHYFENSTTGRVFNVKTKNGWSDF